MALDPIDLQPPGQQPPGHQPPGQQEQESEGLSNKTIITIMSVPYRQE